MSAILLFQATPAAIIIINLLFIVSFLDFRVFEKGG